MLCCLGAIAYKITWATFSTFGIRKQLDSYQDYYDWYIKNEERLVELYDEEYCQSMTNPFDVFCRNIYTGDFKIIYY